MDFGINFNADMDFENVKKLAKLSEEAGFSYIWVGDNIDFPHSFPLLPLIASSTEKAKIGHGIISPFYNRCMHIKKSYFLLKEYYGNRFVAGLSYGDLNALKKIGIEKITYSELEKCADEVEKTGISVFIGASGPRTIERASKKFGILLNYAEPEFLKWAKKFVKKETYLASYAPAMINEFAEISEKEKRNIEKYLLFSCAIVLAGANKTFLSEFGLKSIAEEMRKAVNERDYERIKARKKILLEKFSISGSFHEVYEKCSEIKNLGINQIIFATPFAYNREAIEKAGEIIDALS